MEIVLTPHFKIRYFDRKVRKEKEVRERIKNSFIVPPKFARQLTLIHLPDKLIRKKGFLYAYYPAEKGGEGEFYFLQIKNGEIIAKSVIIVEGVINERLKEANLTKQIKDIIS